MRRTNTKGDAVPGAGVPAHQIILVSRRIMFLQTILQEDESSLLHRFFKAQYNHPTRGDWYRSVDKVFKDLKLQLSLSEVKALKKEDLQKMLKDTCKVIAFKCINAITLRYCTYLTQHWKCKVI